MIKIRVSCGDAKELAGVIRLLRSFPGLVIRSCKYSKGGSERYKKAYLMADLPGTAGLENTERLQRFQNDE